MPVKIQCPSCGTMLSVKDERALLGGRCPKCNHVFGSKQGKQPLAIEPEDRARFQPEEQPVAAAAPPRQRPPQPPKPPPLSAGNSQRAAVRSSSWEETTTSADVFASKAGIILTQSLPSSYSCFEDADAELQLLKREFPVAKSAYQPSGKMPPDALMYMALGFSLAIPFGIVAGGLVLAVGGGITFLLLLLNAVLEEACGVYVCIVLVLPVIAAIITYIATYGVSGWAVGTVVPYMGRIGKNRNPTAPGLVAALSAVVTMVLFHLIVGFVAILVLGNDIHFFGEASLVIFGGLILLGTAIATFAAFWCARTFVKEDKFCERCERYMDEIPLRGTCLGGAQAMTRALLVNNITVAADVLQSTRRGKEALANLFKCPECGCGFIDLWINFEAEYSDEEGQTHNIADSWRVASNELTKQEVRLFRRLIKKNP